MGTNGHRPGFKIPARTLNVDFEGGDYEGAYVKLKLDASLRTVFHFQELGVAGDIEPLLMEFGEGILEEWNLEDEGGKPIPATAEGLMELPSDFGMMLVEKWTEAIQGRVPAPLVETSPDTDTLAALSTPMASA